MEDTELSEAELGEYSAMRSAGTPGLALENRVVDGLRRRGLLRSPVHRRRALVACLTAAALVGLAFFALQHQRPAGPRFMLLLYEGPDFDRAGAHAEEYTAWADEVRKSGTRIDGDELRSGGEVLGDLPPMRSELTGFFVVQTKDRAQAVELARQCPHLKHRGQIVVREIED